MFTHLAHNVSRWAGRPSAFLAASILIVLWAVSGPLFHWSDTWQLVINTGTTIVTFLMVFLIQSTQNRDTAAIHAKLDELIRALADARNEFIGLDKKDEKAIEAARGTC